uniref:S.flexneri 2a 140-megadalton plasmid virF protein n=1 Tax=Shigella flexneri TaxID=623 RepID=Q57203_SHIFL|nr:ORF-B [Shigella flexneri]CAA34649.1 unnamed protein product [Shigella flexneri]
MLNNKFLSRLIISNGLMLSDFFMETFICIFRSIKAICPSSIVKVSLPELTVIEHLFAYKII